MTEEEQIEAIKKMWKKYGNLLLTVLLIGVLAVTGWRWWQKRELSISTQASQIYQQLLNSDSKADKNGVEAMANRLLDSYPKTPYAQQASLILARWAVNDKKLDKALQRITWAQEHASTSSLKQMARLRRARILLTMNKSDQALALIDTVDDKTYLPLVAALRGDIYQAQQQTAKARTAYQQALQSMPEDAVSRAIIQMKLDNLAQGAK